MVCIVVGFGGAGWFDTDETISEVKKKRHNFYFLNSAFDDFICILCSILQREKKHACICYVFVHYYSFGILYYQTICLCVCPGWAEDWTGLSLCPYNDSSMLGKWRKWKWYHFHHDVDDKHDDLYDSSMVGKWRKCKWYHFHHDVDDINESDVDDIKLYDDINFGLMCVCT